SARASVDAATTTAADSAKRLIGRTLLPPDGSRPARAGLTGIRAQAWRLFLDQALANRSPRPPYDGGGALLAPQRVEHPDAAIFKADRRRPAEPRRRASRRGARAQRVDLLRLEHEIRMMAVRGEPVDRPIEPGRLADVPPQRQAPRIVAKAAT